MFSLKIHRYIFLFGLLTAPLGIMLAGVPASLPIIILAANWLLEGRLIFKWHLLKSNKLFWAVFSLVLLYYLGLIYTSNFTFASNELRIALPILILPIVLFSTDSVDQSEFNLFLYSFILGCFLNSSWCVLYGFVLHHVEVGRDLSRLMSHIRLGLFLDFAIFCCFYFFINAKNNWFKLFWMLAVIYFITMLLLLGLASGLVIFSALFILIVLIFIYRQKTFIKIVGIVLVIIFMSFIYYYVAEVYAKQTVASTHHYNQLKASNVAGRSYIHFDSLGLKENGNYVYRNIQLEDLKKSWNARAPQDSFAYTPAYNLKRYHVLLRYLSSASLTKDADGIRALTSNDVLNISNNVTNREYSNWSFLQRRLYELMNEYDDFKNARAVNGHSLLMRFIFWKAACEVVSRHPLIGVGTGDIQDELNKVYQSKFPNLNASFYLRPHNQFLSMAATYGLIGLCIFLISLFYPVFILRKQLPKLFWIYFVILLLSFMTEDTLGTQAGIGFYAIFFIFFCSEANFRRQQILAGLQANH